MMPLMSIVSLEAGGRGYRRCAAIHASRESASVYTATGAVVGCVCVSCCDLPLAGAGRQVLVLSPTRAALKI